MSPVLKLISPLSIATAGDALLADRKLCKPIATGGRARMQGDTFESATTSLPSMMDMWRERSIDMQVAILRLGIGYLVGSILGGGVGGAGSELQKLYVRGSPACYGRGCRADTIPHPACFLDIWCLLGVCYDTLKIGECV